MTSTHRSYLAWVVALLAAGRFYHDVALVTAQKPAGWFPFVPAAVTIAAVMLALYWLSASQTDEG